MRELTTKKGHDYSGDTDVLENFKRNADNLGLEKYQIWSVYFNKHIDAINRAIKDNPDYPEDSSEPFEERAKDAMVYLALMICMRREDQGYDKYLALLRKNQSRLS